MESVNVKVDEYLELNEVIQVHKSRDCKTFIYFYEGISTKELEILAIEQDSITIESHLVEVDSQSTIEL